MFTAFIEILIAPVEFKEATIDLTLLKFLGFSVQKQMPKHLNWQSNKFERKENKGTFG